MKTSLWPLQKALYNRLVNDAALMNIANGVYDAVQDGAAFPYITLGDDTVNDYSTKTWDGEEVTHTLHIWSESKGKREAKQIMDLVLQSITASKLLLDGGFTVDYVTREFLEVLNEGNGYHGVMRLRFKIKQ